MSKAEETRRILKMVEEGTITAEDAAKLLDALEASEGEAKAEAPARKPRWLRVRVYEGGKERPSVNVNIPISLIGLVQKLGGRFLPDDAMGSFKQLLDEIAANPEAGKIVEIADHEDGDRVEIVVE